jgi:hypothetical protein
MLNGFLPQEIEDKLFIYAGGPDFDGHATFHIHCAWTGNKYVELEILTTGVQEDKSKGWNSETTAITWEMDNKTRDDDAKEELAKYIALEACNWVFGLQLVDKIEIPSEWKNLPPGRTIKMEQIAPPGKTRTTYKASTIDQETLNDLKRLMALGPGLEVKMVQGYSITSEMSEASRFSVA